MENTASNTNNFLNWVEIKNFKSIKDLRLDCKRVNVFIGKPNVGKSNILEGLGLLGADYSLDNLLKDSVRYKEVKHLFYENDAENSINILTDKTIAVIQKDTAEKNGFIYYGTENTFPFSKKDYTFDIQLSDFYEETEMSYYRFLNDGIFTHENRKLSDYKKILSAFKKYDFVSQDKFVDVSQRFLIPPHGVNLFSVVDRYNNLKDEFGKLFKEQGLDFVLSRDEQLFELQRRSGYYVYKFDFYTITDTFRRFMFYITAIESNKNSVIIFEEPEVHSFPPYTQDITYRMIYSEENQFFVSTHSPYLLQTLVSNLKDDQLNVFVTYYENYETKVKSLTPEELGFVQEYSTDVFFNLDRFLPNAQSANPA